MRPPAKQRSPLPAEPCDACARSRPISGTYSVKVIPRLLGSLMGIALVATTSVALGADFDVGRVALRVIEDGWTSVGTSSDQLPFSGDLSGASVASVLSIAVSPLTLRQSRVSPLSCRASTAYTLACDRQSSGQ